VRRHAETNSSRKRISVRHITSSNDFSGESGLRGSGSSNNNDNGHSVGQRWDDDDDVNFQENKDEFAIDEEGSGDDWLDDEDEDDDFIDGDINDLGFLDDISPSKKRGSISFAGEGDGSSSSGKNGAARRGSQDINHSTLLCALVRQGYVESMVDLLAKWFPCMFR
jgi:hypothetical protein